MHMPRPGSKKDFWFARYRLSPVRSRGIAPVSWKGWATIGGCLAVMASGGLLMWLLDLYDHFTAGFVCYVVFAFAGMAIYIRVAERKCDPVNTVAYYRRAT